MNVNVNWFDIALLIVVVASIVSGLKTGMARVLVHMVATVAGLLAGFWFYGILAVRVEPYVHHPLAAKVIGFSIIFVVVMILGAIVGVIFANLFKWIGLGWFDHLLGGVLGAIRGAIVVAAIVAVVLAFAPNPLPTYLTESQGLPYAAQASAMLAPLAPRALRDGFNRQVEKLKQNLHPGTSKKEGTA